MFQRILLLSLAVAALLFPVSPVRAAEVSSVGKITLADLDGERLRYTVYWTGIPAAKVELTTRALEDGNYRLNIFAEGSAVVDWIYPVKKTIYSDVSNPGLRPLVHETSGQEGWKDRGVRRIEFPLGEDKSYYYKRGKLQKEMELPPEFQDPLSCLFYFRMLDLPADGETVPLTVADGKTIIEGSVTVHGRERVYTNLGYIPAVKVEPTMEGVRGVFAKSPGAKMYVWLSLDRFRRPIKIESEVVVGSFIAVLDGYDPPPSAVPDIQ